MSGPEPLAYATAERTVPIPFRFWVALAMALSFAAGTMVGTWPFIELLGNDPIHFPDIDGPNVSTGGVCQSVIGLALITPLAWAYVRRRRGWAALAFLIGGVLYAVLPNGWTYLGMVPPNAVELGFAMCFPLLWFALVWWAVR